MRLHATYASALSTCVIIVRRRSVRGTGDKFADAATGIQLLRTSTVECKTHGDRDETAGERTLPFAHIYPPHSCTSQVRFRAPRESLGMREAAISTCEYTHICASIHLLTSQYQQSVTGKQIRKQTETVTPRGYTFLEYIREFAGI